MQVADAQQDMARAHLGGAPGVFVSGLVWLIAGGVWERFGLETAFSALFVGGILIYPASLLIARGIFRAPKTSPGNPFERLALESTFMLFAGLFFAYSVLRIAPDLAFPTVAIAIGVRYLVFTTVYGNRLFWALGGAVATLGAVAATGVVTLPVNLALIVGAVEILLASVILMFGKGGDRRKVPPKTNAPA